MVSVYVIFQDSTIGKNMEAEGLPKILSDIMIQEHSNVFTLCMEIGWFSGLVIFINVDREPLLGI